MNVSIARFPLCEYRFVTYDIPVQIVYELFILIQLRMTAKINSSSGKEKEKKKKNIETYGS